jgi:ElaB/YqjD/DUF883 family membrane-anchored ribosome-binding protein
MSSSTTYDTVERAQDAAKQMSDRASQMLHNARQTAGQWTQKVQDNLESLSDAASDYVGQGREKAEALGRAVGGQVRERPVSALLLAAGIGFLLGIVLRRR